MRGPARYAIPCALLLASCAEERYEPPPSAAGVHAPGIADPRSSGFHGELLRSQRWSPMLDASDPEACGRCHDGTPAPVAGVTFFAPGATACTACHAQSGGALACSTCHGSGTKSYPSAGAHAAHVESSSARPSGFACSTCHPVPGPQVIGGLHGDGAVQVTFDAAAAGSAATYDRTTETCAVTCHDSGGLRPRPAWTDATPMGCNDCHRSPPPHHSPGACTNCHQGVDPSGTALTGGPLHLDGRVELGDGSGRCGACHGSGDSPWPSAGAHASHQSPTLGAPVACASCHPVPATIEDPVHLDGTVHVAFSGPAVARDAKPTWDGARCSATACHGAGLVDPPAVVPRWADTSGSASRCGACHGIPPSQHTPSRSCGDANCHPGEVALDAAGVPSITLAGRALHMNGAIDHY